MIDSYSYVLITAARNEAAYIEKTIKSVLSQTVRPKKWIILDDGSTDRTADIVSQYAALYSFIEYMYVVSDNNRNFGSKANAIELGYENLKGLHFNFLGILDADISFGQTYYQRVMSEFINNPALGIGGGIVFDHCNGKYRKQLCSSSWSVSGPIQMFRRECYEDIGGYTRAKEGGIDAIAEVMARMHGWEVKSFSDIKVFHHRETGTEKRNLLGARFHQGRQDYLLGYHPLFFVIRCIYRIFGRPFLIGSIFMILGYFLTLLKGDKRQVSNEVVEFLKKEQINRLKFWHRYITYS